MKKLFTLMFAFSLLLVGCEKEMESVEVDSDLLKKAGTQFVNPNGFDAEGAYCVLENAPDELAGEQMQLWMGVGNEKAGTLVGHVRFEPDKVIIDLTDADGDGVPDMYPYVIEDIHIHFASDVDGIPHTKKGNPIPGQFEYKMTLDPNDKFTSYEIPVTFYEVGAIHITVTKFGGVDGFAFYLPDEPVTVTFTYPAPTSYLLMEILSNNAGALKGVYENWCVNTSISLDPLLNQEIEALLYSSYEEIPDGIVDYPDNFPLLNYLINSYAVGDEVELTDSNCDPVLVDGETLSEALTIGDIQKAIWTLIDDDPSTNLGLGGWSQERVNAILCDVDTKANLLYKPGCDDKIVFLVVPIDPEEEPLFIIGQPTISSVPVPCADEGGTAWGDGYWGATFPGSKQWGTWFQYGCD